MNKNNISDESPVVRLYIASLGGGGAERVCAALCNGFVSRGVNTELLLVKAFGPHLAGLDSRVHVVDFRASRGMEALIPVSRHLRSPPIVPVLVFGFNLGVSLLLARRIGWHKAPVIYREAVCPRSCVKRNMFWAYRFAIRRANQVIAQNRAVKEELESLHIPSNIISIIPNPVNATLFKTTRRYDKTSTESPLILGVGRLSRQKGFDRLIRAFHGFLKRSPKARLVILGEGEEKRSLERLTTSLGLSRSVSFPGFSDDVAAWYSQASLFCLSSRFEGQPNVLMEAIASCCPVICATNSAGAVELMREIGLEDCLVPDEQFEQLFAERVHHVLSMDNSRWKTAQEKLAQLTDFDTVLRQYLDACGVSFPPNDSASRKP